MAQWLGRRILDQGVPGFYHLPCLVLVEPRKRWTDDRLGQTLNLNLNSLLVKRQIDNPSPGAVTGGN